MPTHPYDLTTHDGKTVDWLTHAALLECERRLGYPLTIVQGSYHKGVGASAGTHDGGGVVDLAPWDWQNKVRVLRAVGFAAWHRPTLPGVWGEHIHAVLIGNAKLAPSAARQVTAYCNGRNGLANNGPDDFARPNPIPTFKWSAPAVERTAPAPPKRKPTPQLTIITANFWRENKHAEQDAKTLAASKAHVIGLNEARGFYPILAKIAGYRLINPDGTGAQDQNPILLRADVKFLGQGARKMCDAVGPSPERWATWVLYEFAGQKRAHVNTHTNAHIENAGKPRALPRVTQNVIHMKRLASLVRELRAQGYKVTVGGDLNWAWTTAAAWYWAPKRVFKRLGMAVNWEAKNAPLGGSKGNRRVDYLAHDPADLTIAAQCFVRGEHSDHRWPEVTYRIKGA